MRYLIIQEVESPKFDGEPGYHVLGQMADTDSQVDWAIEREGAGKFLVVDTLSPRNSYRVNAALHLERKDA